LVFDKRNHEQNTSCDYQTKAMELFAAIVKLIGVGCSPLQRRSYLFYGFRVYIFRS
jgi:hypothetical protein